MYIKVYNKYMCIEAEEENRCWLCIIYRGSLSCFNHTIPSPILFDFIQGLEFGLGLGFENGHTYDTYVILTPHIFMKTFSIFPIRHVSRLSFTLIRLFGCFRQIAFHTWSSKGTFYKANFPWTELQTLSERAVMPWTHESSFKGIS